MSQQDQGKQEIFVGREYEQEEYKVFLEGEKISWILLFIGMPGIGKSTLLRRLKQQPPPDVGIVLIDFQVDRLLTDPLQVLKALAKQANPFCESNQYQAFTSTLQKERDQLKQLKEQITQQIRQIDLQVDGPQGLTLIEQPILSVEHHMHQGIRNKVTDALYAQLDTFKKKRLVLMLDTCERLNEPEGWEVGQWLIGELLPTVHERMEQLDRRCFVVMASRTLLESVVIQEDQQHVNLSILKENEVNEYLKQAGIDNSMLERVYKMTDGHPLALSIVRDLWDDKDKTSLSDDYENISVFQSKFDEKVSTDFVETRILQKLKSPFRELTEYGVLLRSFSLTQLKAIFPDLLPESTAIDVFNQFIDYPYVEPIYIESKGDYDYTLHEFVRGALAKYTQNRHRQEWYDYHKKALDFFTPGDGDPYSPEWYYHSIALDEAEGMKALAEAVEQAKSTGNRGIGSLLRTARDEALDLKLTSQFNLTKKEEQFFRDKEESRKAEERRNHAEFLRQEIKRLKEDAKKLEAKGDGHRQVGDLSSALKSYNQALQLLQLIGTHSVGEANLQSIIDEVKGDEARLQNVVNEITKEIEDLTEKARVLEAEGDDYRQHGDLSLALESYNQALLLFQRIGNHLVDKTRLLSQIDQLRQKIGEKAKDLEAEGDDHRQQGNLGLALESYNQALLLFQRIDNHLVNEARLKKEVEDLIAKAKKLETEGNDHQQQGNLGLALESYNQALLLFQHIGNYPIDEARLKNEIEGLIAKAKKLETEGDDHQQQGNLGLALESYNQALLLFQRIGNYPTDEARLRKEIEKLRQEMGEQGIGSREK